MAVKYALFTLVIGSEMLLGGALVLTLVSRLRVWPPPSRGSWQYRWVWSLTWLAMAGLVALGLTDWDSFLFDHWIRFPIGVSMVAVGLALVGWGVHSLGVQATSGLQSELVTTGPFQYSRNPQYLGEMIWIAGYAVVTNSSLALGAGAFGCLLFVLVPFTEEPWLRNRHGAAFDRYMTAVPRFVGRASFPA